MSHLSKFTRRFVFKVGLVFVTEYLNSSLKTREIQTCSDGLYCEMECKLQLIMANLFLFIMANANIKEGDPEGESSPDKFPGPLIFNSNTAQIFYIKRRPGSRHA